MNNDSIPDKRVDKRQSQSEFSLSPTTLRKILDTAKWTIKKIKTISRDERKQEDYPTSAVYFCRCRVVFLRSFISALFLYFF